METITHVLRRVLEWVRVVVLRKGNCSYSTRPLYAARCGGGCWDGCWRGAEKGSEL